MTKEEQIENIVLKLQKENDYKDIPVDRIRKNVEFVCNSKGGDYRWFSHQLWKNEDGSIGSYWKFKTSPNSTERKLQIGTGDGGAIAQFLWFEKYFTEQFKKAP